MRILKHCRGVTLVELMATLGAAALALTLGVPSFHGLHADMQRTQVRYALAASFALARSEAIRRGAAVSLCPSADGATCAGGQATDWSTGWIVSAAGGQVIEGTRLDQASASLTADQSLSGGVTFSGIGLPSATGALTYSDATTRAVYRLIPIGRLELVP